MSLEDIFARRIAETTPRNQESKLVVNNKKSKPTLETTSTKKTTTTTKPSTSATRASTTTTSRSTTTAFKPTSTTFKPITTAVRQTTSTAKSTTTTVNQTTTSKPTTTAVKQTTTTSKPTTTAFKQTTTTSKPTTPETRERSTINASKPTLAYLEPAPEAEAIAPEKAVTGRASPTSMEEKPIIWNNGDWDTADWGERGFRPNPRTATGYRHPGAIVEHGLQQRVSPAEVKRQMFDDRKELKADTEAADWSGNSGGYIISTGGHHPDAIPIPVKPEIVTPTADITPASKNDPATTLAGWRMEIYGLAAVASFLLQMLLLFIGCK